MSFLPAASKRPSAKPRVNSSASDRLPLSAGTTLRAVLEAAFFLPFTKVPRSVERCESHGNKQLPCREAPGASEPKVVESSFGCRPDFGVAVGQQSRQRGNRLKGSCSLHAESSGGIAARASIAIAEFLDQFSDERVWLCREIHSHFRILASVSSPNQPIDRHLAYRSGFCTTATMQVASNRRYFLA